MKTLMAVIFVFSAFGCGETNSAEPTPPKAEDYDQTCQVNSDCEIVAVDPCSCGACPLPAINRKDYPTYKARVDELQCGDIGDCIHCDIEPSCFQGKCESRERVEIREEDFANNCETVADCRLVNEGEVCQPCSCSEVAVNGADYDSKIGIPKCGYENVACNNCPSPELACVDNVCTAIRSEGL